MHTRDDESSKWIQALEASVCELHRLNLQCDSSGDLTSYIEILIAYHESHVDRLTQLLSRHWNRSLLKEICALRLGIRDESLSVQKLSVAEKFIESQVDNSPVDELLRAEAHFVLGFASESSADLKRAIKHYNEAAKIFTRRLAHKKSIKALFNSLACKSRMDPNSRYLSDCYFVVREASRLGETSVESMARHNLSYELLKLGATEEALHEALIALDLCRDHFANFNELQVRVHLADIYFQIGDYTEAKRHLSFAKVTEFPQTLEAQKFLENTYLNAQHPIDYSKMTHNWQKRVLNNLALGSQNTKKPSTGVPQLSTLESRCLKELAGGPIDKHRLVEQVYGKSGNYFSLENRLKVLLNRLRKKMPNEIRFFKGQYFLKDKSLRSLLIALSIFVTNHSMALGFLPDTDSSLVKVCSRYTNAPAPICGVGTYVQKESRFFILTSSHVSHGEHDLAISLIKNPNKRLKVIARASNTMADVDLIEVHAHPLLQALLVWDSYFEAFVVPDLEKWNWHFLIGRTKMPDAPSPTWLHNLGWTSVLILPSQDQRVTPEKGAGFYEQFFPAQAGLENRRNFSRTLDPYENLIRFTLLPGMSGAPVLTSVAHPFHIRLSSIATRAHRHSPLSYFSTLQNVLPPLLKGKSLKRQPIWNFSDGLLYRSTDDETIEAVLAVKERGDWGSADGGSGTGSARSQLKFFYKGQPILGWRVALSKGRTILLHGSFSNYRTLMHKNLLKHATPIPLYSKLTFTPYQRPELQVENESGDTLTYKANRLTVKLANEKISFTLNEWGALNGTVFNPIIRVKGRTIDITELYFIEASYRRLLSDEDLKASFSDNAIKFSTQKRVLISERIVSWPSLSGPI